MTGGLERRLGVGDAVVVGLGAMLGAGVFAAFGPAARVAGTWLLAGLAIAAFVAGCNATSTARLAARHPESGGAYLYGTRRLGAFWGHQAGWAFVVGKSASCAAMAITVAAYLAPDHRRTAAAVAVVAVTAVNLLGVRKSAAATRVIIALTLATLALVVVAALAGGTAEPLAPAADPGVRDVLQAAGLLFFAFAGYARIATLGEEVRDPERTITRAVPVALGITLVVYAVVAVAALSAIGPGGLAAAADPLRAVVEAGDLRALGPVIAAGAAVAALGSLLSLSLGVSRTALAMARDGHLPRALAAVDPSGSPRRAELAVGAVVLVLVLAVDLRGAIGFSSFGVLTYYAVANAAALRLGPDERPPPRWLPVAGLAGCAVLAFSLPVASVAAGIAVLAAGALLYAVRRS